MKFIVMIVLMLGLLIGGYLYFINGEESLGENNKEIYKKIAIRYIETDPIINDRLRLSRSWENYNLGSDPGLRFSSNWLDKQIAIVYLSSSDVVSVEWQGIPGCNVVKPWDVGYKPEIVDENGKNCQTWWTIRVEIDKDNNSAKRIKISEVGYGETVL